jgi:nucleotide-binding universal stress UspA family protein
VKDEMTMPPLNELTILVPVDISGPETPTLDILDRFGPIEVVLLGYFPVPVQAEPALIKDEYEAAAESKLVELAEGRPDLTEVLVFTHDRNATIDRVADEYGCDAVLTTGDMDSLDRILVPVRGDANLDRIVSVVAGLLAASPATATLFHSVAEDAEPSQGEYLLRGATGRLADFGVDDERIDWRLSERGDPLDEITELAADYDLVVFGETEPSLRERIVGDVLARIIDGIDRPALVVRDVE